MNIKRIDVYCRFEKADDLTTFSDADLQRNHYENLIPSRPELELVEMYVDEGSLSSPRPEFIRMLKDCQAGKIDLIVTKDMSRVEKDISSCLRL